MVFSNCGLSLFGIWGEQHIISKRSKWLLCFGNIRSIVMVGFEISTIFSNVFQMHLMCSKVQAWGRRDGSVVKSTVCSFRQKDHDLPRDPVETWFFQLQIRFCECMMFGSLVTLGKCKDARAREGWWLLLPLLLLVWLLAACWLEISWQPRSTLPQRNRCP